MSAENQVPACIAAASFFKGRKRCWRAIAVVSSFKCSAIAVNQLTRSSATNIILQVLQAKLTKIRIAEASHPSYRRRRPSETTERNRCWREFLDPLDSRMRWLSTSLCLCPRNRTENPNANAENESTTLATLDICILAFAYTNTKGLRVPARIDAFLLALGIVLDLAELEAYATGSTVLAKVLGNVCRSINRVVPSCAGIIKCRKKIANAMKSCCGTK